MPSVKNIIETELPLLTQTVRNLPWNDKDFYAQYLAQTYYYVSHSVKLLKYAAEKTSDPKLKAHLTHHIDEEKGHEKWALSDLKNLGFDIKSFKELPATRKLYSSIYQGIDEYGPIAIVGYAMALESLSADQGPSIGKRLVQLWGESCSTFITAHGEKDQGHNEVNFDLLNIFTEKDLKILKKYISESFINFQAFLLSIVSCQRQAA